MENLLEWILRCYKAYCLVNLRQLQHYLNELEGFLSAFSESLISTVDFAVVAAAVVVVAELASLAF